MSAQAGLSPEPWITIVNVKVNPGPIHPALVKTIWEEEWPAFLVPLERMMRKPEGRA